MRPRGGRRHATPATGRARRGSGRTSGRAGGSPKARPAIRGPRLRDAGDGAVDRQDRRRVHRHRQPPSPSPRPRRAHPCGVDREGCGGEVGDSPSRRRGAGLRVTTSGPPPSRAPGSGRPPCGSPLSRRGAGAFRPPAGPRRRVGTPSAPPMASRSIGASPARGRAGRGPSANRARARPDMAARVGSGAVRSTRPRTRHAADGRGTGRAGPASGGLHPDVEPLGRPGAQ